MSESAKLVGKEEENEKGDDAKRLLDEGEVLVGE